MCVSYKTVLSKRTQLNIKERQFTVVFVVLIRFFIIYSEKLNFRVIFHQF